MSDNERIYDILQKQGEILARIDESQKNTHNRLFGGNGETGVIPHLYVQVNRHESQITFWRGALAVLSVLWTAALAWGGVIVSKHAK